VAFVIAAFALGGCASTSKELPEDQRRLGCEASGGYYRQVTRSGEMGCVRPTSDGGKECRDSSECEGYCEAGSHRGGENLTGKCTYKTVMISGCMNRLWDGIALGTLCKD